jgi:hypothetical protein
MRNSKKKVQKAETLIESIFKEEAKRKMSDKERSVLLRKPKKVRRPK